MIKFDPQWQSTTLISDKTLPTSSAKQQVIGADLEVACDTWIKRLRGLHQQYHPEADQEKFVALCQKFKRSLIYHLIDEEKSEMIRKFLTAGHAFVDIMLKQPDAHKDLKVNFMAQIETYIDACVPATHNFLIDATNTLQKIDQAGDDLGNLVNTFKDHLIEDYLKQYFHNEDQADIPKPYFGHLPAWLAQQIYPRDIQKHCTIDFLESRVSTIEDPFQKYINRFLIEREKNHALLATMQSEETGQVCTQSTLTEALSELKKSEKDDYVRTIVAGHLSHYLSQNLTTSHFLEFMVENIKSELISLSFETQMNKKFDQSCATFMPKLMAEITAYNLNPGALIPLETVIYGILPALEHGHLGSKTIAGYANGNELLTFDDDDGTITLNKTALKSAWRQQIILNTLTQYGIHPMDVVQGDAAILPFPEHPPAQPSSGESKQASGETSPPQWNPLDHLNQTALKDALARACPTLIRTITVMDKASPASTQADAGGESPPDHSKSKAAPHRTQVNAAPEAMVVPTENQQQLYDWLQDSVQLWSNDALAAVCAKHLSEQQSPLVKTINSDLFPLAVKNGLTATVRVCLTDDSMCPNPDRPLLQDRTPLMWACANGHLDIAKMLVEKKANLSATAQQDGNTMMHFAAMNGHTMMVQWLLEIQKPVPPNADNRQGHSPLYLAVQAGHAATVKTLCQGNPTVDQLKSSMKIAAAGQHTSCEKIILQALFEHLTDEEKLQYFVKVVKKWQDPALTSLFFQQLPERAILRLDRKHHDINNSILWMAIRADDTAILKALLHVHRNALNLNQIHPRHRVSPLAYALEHNKLHAIVWLDSQGISLPKHISTNNSCDTALTWAAKHGKHALLHTLLRMNASIDKPNDQGTTALMAALQNDHYDLAADLLQAGANPSHQNTNGVTALHIAVQEGHHKIIVALKDAGADVNAAITGENKKGWAGHTALHIAALHDHQMVSALLQAGADVNATITGENKKGWAGHTTLHIAAENGDHQIVSALLQAGADVNATIKGATNKDLEGFTALHIAALQGHHKTIVALKDAGADINAAITGENKKGWAGQTALHIAALQGHHKIIVALKDAGADVNAAITGGTNKDLEGHTALHIAARRGDYQMVSALLQAGADVNATITGENKKGWAGHTALHIATRRHNHQMVSALLQAGADVNKNNFDGHTSFDVALAIKEHTYFGFGLATKRHHCAKILLEVMCRMGTTTKQVERILQYLDATADTATVVSLIKTHFTARIPDASPRFNAYQTLVSDPVNYQLNRANLAQSSWRIIRFFIWLFNLYPARILSHHDDPLVRYLDQHQIPQQALRQAAFQHRVQPTRSQALTHAFDDPALDSYEDDYSSSPWDTPVRDLGPRISLGNSAYDY